MCNEEINVCFPFYSTLPMMMIAKQFRISPSGAFKTLSIATRLLWLELAIIIKTFISSLT